nr:vacuolar fusion protein MON1 homolog isoform X2 [Ipomoea batatas]
MRLCSVEFVEGAWRKGDWSLNELISLFWFAKSKAVSRRKIGDFGVNEVSSKILFVFLDYVFSLQNVQSLEEIDVLKEIGCIDVDLVVQIKGRVACEMNSVEELICTECLFENQMDYLEPEEAVAIMSAFVFQQKESKAPSLTPKLSQAIKRYGDEHKLAGFSATLQAIISFVENGGDRVKLIRAGKHQRSLMSLRGQLELLYGQMYSSYSSDAYMQMILILTKSVNRCFEKNPKFDMTPLLEGTDVVFSSDSFLQLVGFSISFY